MTFDGMADFQLLLMAIPLMAVLGTPNAFHLIIIADMLRTRFG